MGSSSPILRDLEKGIYEGRNMLVFEHEGAILPDHLIVDQLLILFDSESKLTPQQTEFDEPAHKGCQF